MENKIEWINIKDRYPEDEEKVLVVFWGEVCTGVFFEDSHWCIYAYASHENKRLDLDNAGDSLPIHFWAKLPLPPTEEIERAKI